MFQIEPTPPRMPTAANAGGGPDMAGSSPPRPAPSPVQRDGVMNGTAQAMVNRGQGNSGLPPQLQRYIDPNNPVQAALMRRLQAMTSQDAAALVQGVAPQALQVLRKLLPDISFVWDGIAAKQGGAGANGQQGQGSAIAVRAGAGNSTARPPVGTPINAPGRAQAGPRVAIDAMENGPQRPKTRLSTMQ